MQISPDTARRGLHAAEQAGLLSVVREPGCKLVVSVVDPPGEDEKSPRPLYGPIPWAWWLTALRLDGPAVRTAAACWLVGGWERSAEFQLAMARWADLGLSRFGAGRGLGRLEGAGLVAVGRRRGATSTVTVLDGPRPPVVEEPTDSSGTIAGA